MIDVLDILREANPDAISCGCGDPESDHLLDVVIRARVWLREHPQSLDPVDLAEKSAEAIRADGTWLIFGSITQISQFVTNTMLYEPVE